MRFIDAHTHLADFGSFAEALNFARMNRVVLCSASTTIADSQTNLEIARENEGLVRPFCGIHPSNANDFSSALMKSSLWEDCYGLGEIGLDPKYSELTTMSIQMNAFKSQLQIAADLSKPIQVHSRNAEKLSLDTLADYSVGNVLLHWFEGENFARIAEERRYFISVGPALLYSKKLVRIVKNYDRELVLTETDGPITYSIQGRTMSGPHLLATVVFKLCELWGTGFEDAARTVASSAANYLSLSQF